jgi:hypothetical protein
MGDTLLEEQGSTGVGPERMLASLNLEQFSIVLLSLDLSSRALIFNLRFVVVDLDLIELGSNWMNAREATGKLATKEGIVQKP